LQAEATVEREKNLSRRGAEAYRPQGGREAPLDPKGRSGEWTGKRVAGGEAPRPGWTGRRRAQRTTDPAASVDAPVKTNVFLLGGGKSA